MPAAVGFARADCDKLPPPVLPFQNVSFSYSGNAEGMLYKDLEFGIDCDSRIALVGPNGAGAQHFTCNASPVGAGGDRE
jgi:ATPase subunit of ABC transporter with duplicated ATPase domains